LPPSNGHARPRPLAEPSWAEGTARLAAIAERRLFFIGGAPRSGTTWLQQMLDAHPAICCRGEGLFLHHFAVPLERILSERALVIAGKNRDLFSHTGGFAQYASADSEHLVATAILLAFARFAPGADCRALGEKTPENAFFFPRLRAMFPDARFIGIARDPRDVLSSAWHFFGGKPGQSIKAYVQAALPSMQAGMVAMRAFADEAPQACRLVTYEALLAQPALVLGELCALLDVPAAPAVIEAMVAATSFGALTGRDAGEPVAGAFLHRGVAGSWRETLPPALAQQIVDALGWSFDFFQWTV
jgi:hypothetical protein